MSRLVFYGLPMATKKPTLEHFSQWIDDHLRRSLTEIGQAVTAVAGRHSAKGAYQSGATVVVTYQEAHALFEKGVKTALGELKRTMHIADLNENALRQKTEQLLREYAEKAKAATRPETLKQFAGSKVVDERLALFDGKLSFLLEHFDVGFLDPAEPEPPPSMSMTIGTVVSSAIQQGATARRRTSRPTSTSVMFALPSLSLRKRWPAQTCPPTSGRK